MIKVIEILRLIEVIKKTIFLEETTLYSGSKGAAELIIRSYFKSIISYRKNLSINVARAGNVIGGGDWSYDRVIPDCVKSWSKNKAVKIRKSKFD